VATSKTKSKSGATTQSAAKSGQKGTKVKAAPAKAAKAPVKAKPEPKAKGKDAAKKKIGPRGAAPWAARHAAKHLEEQRARSASPPPPGSARATIRTPAGAEDIKLKISLLHQALTQIKTLKKNLAKGFFDMGLVLRDIRDRRLFEAKGFGNFEQFLEREMDYGRITCLRIVKLTSLFQRDAALELGMDRIFTALAALEGEVPEARPSGKIPPAPISTTVLPLKPPGRV
jgi:hypothetical protein